VSNLLDSVPLRWIVAVIAFPIGGYLGHLIGGPVATIPAALISGAVAGAIIGVAQGFALKLPIQTLAIWTAATGVALALGLAAVTAVIGQIDTTPDAMVLGAVSGLLIGAGQAALLMRQGIANAWMLGVATTAAWAIGWFVTASIGVALASGWPVYGLSGTLASQVITGLVVWWLMARGEVAAPAPA
jgi:hypothetical protein